MANSGSILDLHCVIAENKPDNMTATTHNWLLRSRPFLIFLPIILGLGILVARSENLTIGDKILLPCLGLLAWTLVEWVAHRAMHAQPTSKRLACFLDELHMRHHREPHDLEHAVISLRAAIPLAIILFCLEWLILQSAWLATAFHAGLLSGYLCYEYVHLATHRPTIPRLLRPITRYHLLHHYQNPRRGYGVTSPLWDAVFGTLPDPRKT